MAKYKMVAIDLDGTLLSPDGTVSAANRAAIHRALEAGLLICFATGRSWTESQMILDAVNHYPHAVFAGGAMVVDTRDKVTLHRTAMEPTLAREVCKLIESMGHAALALQDPLLTGQDYLVTQHIRPNQATTDWVRATNTTLHPVPDLPTYPHDHTIRVGVVASSEETRRVRDALRTAFGERIYCHSLFVPTYGVEVLEVFDPAVNKWEGILHVARRHNIAPEQIVAIGDDINDLPMVTRAGLGVAMGNAKPEIQASANRVIGTNQQDGLATFLDELISTGAVEPGA